MLWQSSRKTDARGVSWAEPRGWNSIRVSLHRRHFGIFSNPRRTLESPEVSHSSSEESLPEVEACEMQVCERGSGTLGACPYEARSTDKSSPHRNRAGFPSPRSIHDVRRFLGLSSYYHRFIPNFVKIAHPLHQLTSKGVPFVWSAECEVAFTTLKGKLTVSPVLAYTSFDRGFTLETDASIQGLRAV